MGGQRIKRGAVTHACPKSLTSELCNLHNSLLLYPMRTIEKYINEASQNMPPFCQLGPGVKRWVITRPSAFQSLNISLS